MQTRLRLIRQLADGRFQSGEKLAEQLGISRAAVWKQLKLIEQEMGIKLDAVRGKGYRMRKPLELLSVEQIEAELTGRARQAIDKLHIHPVIDSTNSWLMQQARNAVASGTVCLAEQQTAGKGRHGRQWVSPFGGSIYLSLLWRFELAPAELAGLSLACGIAVLRTLRQYGCHEAGLKWPNDVLWKGKKLAGLLLEVAGETTGPSHVVIGLGLNIALNVVDGEIDQPWVDLSSIPDVKSYTRNGLIASLLVHLVDVIDAYQKNGLSGFIDEWNDYDLLKGEQVVVRSPNRVYQGVHQGIDPSGGLMLKIDGTARTFFAGEVSLRKYSG